MVIKAMNEKNIKLNNRLVITVIVLLFSAPLLASWLLLKYTEITEFRRQTNHGDLISPPRPLPDIKLIDPLSDTNDGKLHGKWSLFYIVDDFCDQACLDNLYRMRQIHMAAGKYSLRVQRAILITHSTSDDPAQVFKDYAGQRLLSTNGINIGEFLEKFHLKDERQPEQKHRLYIIDPLGNLMMSYPPDADPGGIIKDLSQLLKASHIG